MEQTPATLFDGFGPFIETPTEDTEVSLSPEQQKKYMEEIFAIWYNSIGPSWLEVLEPEFHKPYFTELLKFVVQEMIKGTVYPPPEDVFSFTRACDIKDVKVIIIGQDPYPGPNQAHGLAFSVRERREGDGVPKSLENIYKELSRDIAGFQDPGHSCLLGWAEQGVLLLNTILTVQAGDAGSHKDKGWETFTDAIISWFNNNCSGIVFILWGVIARKKGAFIDKEKHHILEGVHPASRSAGFFGCRHFSKCNARLVTNGKIPIDWNYLP